MEKIFMKRLKVFIATGLMLLCLNVCKSPVGTNEQWISNAENMMWQKPDSALAILNLVDTARLNEHQKTVYTLLYTQATDKTDGDITQLSDVFRLREYFDRTGNYHYAALASFYEGRIFLEKNDDKDALKSFLTAAAYEKKFNDNRLKGLIRLNIGILNYFEPDLTEAVSNLQKAYEFFYRANEPIYQVRALMMMGNSFFLDKNNEQALQSFEKALNICHENQIEQLKTEIAQNMGAIFLSMGEHQKANELFRQVQPLFNSEENSMITSLNLAKSYFETGDLDSARFYIRHAEQFFDHVENPHAMVKAYNLLSKIEEKDGRFEQALMYYKQYTDSLFKIKDSENELNMYRIRQEHDADMYRKKSEILARNFWIAGLAASLFFIVLAIIVYWRNSRHREAMRQAGQKIEELQQMQETYNAKDLTIRNLILQHFDIIRKASLLQHEQISKGANEELLKMFNRVVYDTDVMNWNSLYQQINKLKDNLMDRINLEFEQKRLEEEDFKVFCLTYAGFRQKETAIILRISTSKIQKRMEKIRKTFKTENNEDLFEMLNKITKKNKP